MNNWEQELRARYEAVPVPGPIRTIDAISEEFVEAESKFFNDVIDSLQLNYLAKISILRFRDRMLVEPSYEPNRYSEDYVKQLELDDVALLASSIRVRDYMNYQVAYFSKHDLTPGAIRLLAEVESINEAIDPISRFPRFSGGV